MRLESIFRDLRERHGHNTSGASQRHPTKSVLERFIRVRVTDAITEHHDDGVDATVSVGSNNEDLPIHLPKCVAERAGRPAGRMAQIHVGGIVVGEMRQRRSGILVLIHGDLVGG